jgi:hypothetical protein
LSQLYPAIIPKASTMKNFLAEHGSSRFGLIKNLILTTREKTNKTYGYLLDTDMYVRLALHAPSKQWLNYFFGDLQNWNHCNLIRDGLEKLAKRVDQDINETLGYIQYLEFLGYRFYTTDERETMLDLPDLEALQGGWEFLRVQFPEMNLPDDLDIVSIDGIVPDREFTELYLNHNGALSLREEFVHDHYSHITTRLLLMLKNGAAYPEVKKRDLGLIQTFSLAIQIALSSNNALIQANQDLLYFLLGMLTDAQYSVYPTSAIEAFDLESEASYLKGVWGMPPWQPYLSKRFPGRDFTVMRSVWKQVCEITSDYNKKELSKKRVESSEESSEFLQEFTKAYSWNMVMSLPSFETDPIIMESFQRAISILYHNKKENL